MNLATTNLVYDNTIITPKVHEVLEVEVLEVTEEVYEDAEKDALETGNVVVINVVEETEEPND